MRFAPAGLQQTQTTYVLITEAASEQHKINEKHPGQSRGPQAPLTKRVSLPACRELLEEWWLGYEGGGKVKRVSCKIPEAAELTDGKGGNEVKGWMRMGVGDAHRLDGGGVGGFSDRALGPGEIRGSCLEKQKSPRTHFTTDFHSVHRRNAAVK